MNLLFAIATLLAVAAQAPKGPERPDLPPVLPGTSSISGHVLDPVGKPVEGVSVLITERPAPATKPLMRTSRTKTNRDGAFVFRGIAAGAYLVVVNDGTHVPTAANGFTEILEGEARNDVIVNLRMGGLVKGRLIDHEGQPLSGVRVTAWLSNGNRMGGGGESGADGRFEIRTAEPGPAFIAADLKVQSSTRVFYPGVLSLDDAAMLMIESGGGADLEFHVPEITAASITAHISAPDGYRIDELNLLRPDTNMRLPLSADERVVSAINLRQGRYAIEARATTPEEVLAGFVMIDLQSVDIEVPLILQTAGTVSGKIVLERGGLPPVDGVRVAAVWTSGGVDMKPSPDETSVGPDGAFRFTGLFGHRDFRVFGLPDTWQVTAIRAGRTDISTSGLDIASGSTTELTIVVARR